MKSAKKFRIRLRQNDTETDTCLTASFPGQPG